MKPKMLIIGLDGASWPVVRELAADGRLPNIRKIMAQGASGPLMSLSVTASPIVWTTLATGKTPENHGVQEFIVDATAVKTKRLWDIVQEHNMSVGIYGWLVTYPPKPVNGFLIPCWLATSPETYPAELAFIKKIELGFKGKYNIGPLGYLRAVLSALKWGAKPGTILGLGMKSIRKIISRRLSPETYWKTRSLSMSLHMELFERLLKHYQPDFATVVVTEIDNISHRYWMYFEPDKFNHVSKRKIKKYGDVIPKMYQKADEYIGRLLTAIDDDTTVLVISDHGFQALPISQRISPEKLFSDTRFENAFHHWYIGPELYLKPPDNDEGRALFADAIAFLKNSRVKESKTPLFEVSQEEPGIVKLRIRKDVIDMTNPMSTMSVSCNVGVREISLLNIMSEDDYFMSGFHAPEGIFIAKGKHIRENVAIHNASVLDIAPTVLRILDFPLDEEMDGKVLEQALNERFLKTHTLKTVPSYAFDDTEAGRKAMDTESEKQIMERLKRLGYM